MRRLFGRLSDETAATSIEYAIMAGMILLVAIAAIAALGDQTGVMDTDIQSEMESHGIK